MMLSEFDQPQRVTASDLFTTSPCISCSVAEWADFITAECRNDDQPDTSGSYRWTGQWTGLVSREGILGETKIARGNDLLSRYHDLFFCMQK